ncbi:MAG: tRNA glutamyl-Q(34) synthetase GluQRS [Myxococcales bacterium]|nr:tRNA glutamyl-Q(34) synthetase GluQRS [Myxococcales bacterium]
MMDAVAGTVVGRLAPSPTGVLHVGNARSLLWAWLSVRAAGGRVLLRIEDLLPGAPAHLASMLSDLLWLGLDWDEPDEGTLGSMDPGELLPAAGGRPAVVLQSARSELYIEVMGKLVDAGLVYPCVCTRKDIALASRAPHAEDKGRAYPGTCRGRFAGEGAAIRWEGAQALRLERRRLGCALRIRVPSETIRFSDRICGPQAVHLPSDSGDFVVRKKDGHYAYMFAVVVDDLAMGVTEVIRGDDLLDCTGQQIALYDAILTHGGLSGGIPTWSHVPLVLGDDGRRLAKRNRSIHVQQLAADGVDPARLRRWLAESMGLPATGDLDALVDAAREGIPAAGSRQPVTFVPELLRG